MIVDQQPLNNHPPPPRQAKRVIMAIGLCPWDRQLEAFRCARCIDASGMQKAGVVLGEVGSRCGRCKAAVVLVLEVIAGGLIIAEGWRVPHAQRRGFIMPNRELSPSLWWNLHKTRIDLEPGRRRSVA